MNGLISAILNIRRMRCKWILVALSLMPLINGLRIQGTDKTGGGLSHMEFQHQVILDQMGNYIMRWTPLEKEIHIEIQVCTKGYIGIGFSPNGGMKGADIVLAWIDDLTGDLHVHDRFAYGNMIPVIDDVQDITVNGGYQNNTHTVLRFYRPWNTCDDIHDFELSGDTTRVIWSYSSEDPFGDMDMRKHDHRGTKSIYLREPRFALPTFSEDVKSMEFILPQVRIPDDQHTMYWCQIYRIPDLVGKNHMIGYVPVIQEGHEEHVHHFLLYECHLNESSFHYERWLREGGRQCAEANMPPSWSYCSHPIVAWAIGSEGELFPERVGLPLGEDYGGANYFMIEVHYDNPQFKKGLVDNSGVRILYTDKPREIDGGVLLLGGDVTPTIIIPPGQKWIVTGMCSGECTGKSFPKEGIRVFQGLLHAHLLGRAITVKQIRNGRELPIVLKDMNYDFNYQQTRVLKEEMVILPGDTLIVECTFDSTMKPNTTFGGDSTNEEMCQAVLSYYPRVELSLCYSAPQLSNILQSLGVRDIYDKEKVLNMGTGTTSTGIVDANTLKANDNEFLLKPNLAYESIGRARILKNVVLKDPYEYQNRTLYDLLNDAELWRNPMVLAALQDEMYNGTQIATCISTNPNLFEGVSDTVRYPDFISFKPLKDECAAPKPVEIFETYKHYEGNG